MKELEIEKKMTEIVQDNKRIINEARERTEKFVSDILGDEWQCRHFSHNRFSIRMVRDEQEVFGCDFDVWVEPNWHYENNVFVCTPKVEANIGSCGSFEISESDDHMRKYLALARFLTSFQRYGEKAKFLRDYEKVEKNYEEYRRLDDELTGRKEQ
jgi:hypothetical protein